MITAVLVDDERPALLGMETLLIEYPEISVVGSYTDPFIAIDQIRQLKPRVVFLDMNMPQLMGIDAASKINDLSPGTDIVFVTAFDQYAVEAFDLYALDYILKPIDPARLDKTIERLQSKPPVVAHIAKKLQIKCLGKFQVGWKGQEPIKWRAEKTRELFAFLLYNQGQSISKDLLLDQLWPDDDPDKAIRQLYNGIYYIRKTLEKYGIDRSLVCIDSSYNLKLGAVDYDVGRLYKLERCNSGDCVEILEEMEALYRGDYLEAECYPWADIERTRLEDLLQQCLIWLVRLYIENKEFARADSKLKKAYNRNPYDESVTELFLELYQITEQKSKAVRHFEAYAGLLKEEIGIDPSEKIRRLYQSIMQVNVDEKLMKTDLYNEANK